MPFSDPEFSGYVIPVWQILIHEFIMRYSVVVQWLSLLGAIASCFVFPTLLLFRATRSRVVRYVLWPLLHVLSLTGHTFLSGRGAAYLSVLYQAVCVSMTWGYLLATLFRPTFKGQAGKWAAAILFLVCIPPLAFTLVPFQPSAVYAIQYSFPFMPARYAFGVDFYQAAFSRGAGSAQYLNLLLGGLLMPVSNHTWMLVLLVLPRVLFWRPGRAAAAREAKDAKPAGAGGAGAGEAGESEGAREGPGEPGGEPVGEPAGEPVAEPADSPAGPGADDSAGAH